MLCNELKILCDERYCALHVVVGSSHCYMQSLHIYMASAYVSKCEHTFVSVDV